VAGRTIPEDLREICTEMAGHELLGGNLRIYPLEADDPDALTVANASERVWLPREGGARPVVVEIGAVFEEACLAVVAEDLEAFLRAWGTYYGLLLGRQAEVQALIAEFEVLEELASLDEKGSEEEFYAVLAWASPGLPDPRPDPYERGLTSKQVDEFARSDRR
jgi:hypothetical protein